MAINNIIGKKDAAELNLIGQAVDDLPIQDVLDHCGGKHPFHQRLWTFLRSMSVSSAIFVEPHFWPCFSFSTQSTIDHK